MRIISDFHDYYDVGMQNGIDLQLPYRRFRCEEKVDLYVPWDYRLSAWSYKNYAIIYFGFAGKIYPAIEQIYNSNETVYGFNLDMIDPKFFNGYVEWYCERGKRREKERKELLVRFKNHLKKAFAFQDKKEFLDLFEQFKTAIFVYRLGSGTIVINERLNQYGFQKILPPLKAFQELEMYVGSYLTKPVIEEPPISDKIKAEIHGFDKYSFRKDKS
ncbi:MAG: hypothetical protein FWH27_13875 [Planctomycetaceae bacterium]|nr:hypothetical protein [Planctomycetaceae bacterium]